jgi:hypothetical protein
MGLELWNTEWVKIYCPTICGGNFVWVNVLVNGCTAKLVLIMESFSVGTAWQMTRLSPKVFHVCDLLTVSTVQHTYSSAAQIFQLPIYTSPCYNDVLILWYQNRGTAAWRLARIERFTNDVWCKALSVETCNGKSCRLLWVNGIKVDIWKILLFLWRHFGSFKHTKYWVP